MPRASVLRAPVLRTPVSSRRGGRTDRRRAWWVGGSVALHLTALALLLVTRRPQPDQPMAPNYELVFDNGGASKPSTSEQTSTDALPQAMAENPTAAQEPAPAAATPPPAPVPDLVPPEPPPPAPPAAQVEPSPPPPSQQAMALPDPAVPPTPPDAAPQPNPPQPAPAPAPAQPAPVQPAPAELPQPQASKTPPAVRLAQPDEPPSVTAMTQVPDFRPPLPPPPAPPPPTPPRLRPPAPPRQALGSLSSPMDLNFGPAASRAPAPRGSVASRAIDFSLGAPKPGPNRSEAFFDIRAANIGADWAQGLAAYWLRHRYYPSQAAEAGEDGTVKIQIVVNRLGRVQSVEVLTRSGSPWLDMAAVGTWRNAQLAPLPAENSDPTITIPLTINYLLIR